MTSDDAIDIKEVVFLTDGIYAAYAGLPDDVVEAFDQRISSVQNGQRLPRKHHEELGAALSGIEELRASYDTNTYRTYYVASYPEVVIILDAGMKKSKKGSEIPKEQKETLLKRKKAADALYEQNQGLYRERFAKREANRARHPGPSTVRIQSRRHS